MSSSSLALDPTRSKPKKKIKSTRTKPAPQSPPSALPASLTVRIDRHDHARLRALAKAHHTSMQEVLRRALRALERNAFFQNVNQGYATLRKNTKAWQAFETERTAWDATLSDGLDDP